MNYDDFTAIQDDIYQAFVEGEISEDQLHKEMETLQEQWEEEGEE